MLNSFQQVEDYLATVRVYSQAVLRQQEAVESSQELLKLEVVRYESGVDSYLDVLIAQTKLLTNQQNPAATQIEESVGAVDLVQALAEVGTARNCKPRRKSLRSLPKPTTKNRIRKPARRSSAAIYAGFNTCCHAMP